MDRGRAALAPARVRGPDGAGRQARWFEPGLDQQALRTWVAPGAMARAVSGGCGKRVRVSPSRMCRAVPSAVVSDHLGRSYPQQPPDLSSGLALAVVDKNFARQGSLQK